MAASSQRSPNTNANDATISPTAIPMTRSRVISPLVILNTSLIRKRQPSRFYESQTARVRSLHNTQASLAECRVPKQQHSRHIGMIQGALNAGWEGQFTPAHCPLLSTLNGRNI